MHRDLLDITIETIRRREAEGDCPTTPAYSVEWLENAVLTLAEQADAARAAIAEART